MTFTAREIQLIEGMIQVQHNHAERCRDMANKVMAERQAGWDMERIALLEKLKLLAIEGLEVYRLPTDANGDPLCGKDA
jgi:hypothetical protein